MPDLTPVVYPLSSTNTFEDCPEPWKKFIHGLNIPWQVERSTRHEIIHTQLAKWNARVVSDDSEEWINVEFDSEEYLFSWLITHS
jgi:hypothetical protein